MRLRRVVAVSFACAALGCFALARPTDSALDKKLLKIASDAIDLSVWKGATPDARYAVIVDHGTNWEIDYKYPPPRQPVVGYVTINKKTMKVTKIYFNE